MLATELLRVSWPAARLVEAITTLGLHSGLLDSGQGADELALSFHRGRQEDQAGCGYALEVEDIAAHLGLEAEAVELDYPEVRAMLPRTAPALLQIPTPSGPRLLLVIGSSRNQLAVLDPDARIAQLHAETIRLALCSAIESTSADVIENLLNETGVRGRRRDRARTALLKEFLAGQRLRAGWILRPGGDAPLKKQSQAHRLGGPLAILALAYGFAFSLWIASWWLIGEGFVSGHLDAGWLTAWGLALFTLVPFRVLASYAGGLFSIRAGAFLKRRLLFGALRLDPDEIRHQGMGQLLGQSMEVETVEQLAISGGFLAIAALIELVLSVQVIALGAGGDGQVLILGAWLAVSLGLGGYYLRQRRTWTAVRLALTHELVEGMVGHRTRAVQAPRERWSEAEDHALEHYHRVCLGLDRAALYLQVIVPRGWFISGMAGLAPTFVAGGTSLVGFAIGLGGVLLAYQAFRYLAEGLERSLAAWVGWEQIQPFWRAASRPVCLGEPGLAAQQESADAGVAAAPAAPADLAEEASETPLIECRNLGFRHAERAEPVLRKVNIKIFSGDKILLQGPSGSGKSTLGMLIAGQRQPSAGLCLLGGLDRVSLGDYGWRQQVVIVPQFHENHVFSGTLAFNLLLGRGWPPVKEDLDEAEALCHALGLGPLLERMPAGLQQWLGETGWQLSHGERDRLCIARALLQGPELIILDESFAAFDPQTLREAMAPVLNWDSALIVIAHV